MGAARPNGFISAHRVVKSGTHTGFWTYGPPTGRDWVSRTVAHCLVQDNQIVEEWLVRDEWAVLEHLGLDPYTIAADLAMASPVLGGGMAPGADIGAFAGRITDPAWAGVSGRRPDRHWAECAFVQSFFEEVWNQRLLNRVQGIDPYQIELIDLLPSFPDFRVEARDIAVPAQIHAGFGHFGPPTGAPVHIMGFSHAEIVDGQIRYEWVVTDEVAVWKQIIAHGMTGGG